MHFAIYIVRMSYCHWWWRWWCNCKSCMFLCIAHVRRWLIHTRNKTVYFCLHFTVVPEIWHILVLKKPHTITYRTAYTGLLSIDVCVRACVCFVCDLLILPINFASSPSSFSHITHLLLVRIYISVQYSTELALPFQFNSVWLWMCGCLP